MDRPGEGRAVPRRVHTGAGGERADLQAGPVHGRPGVLEVIRQQQDDSFIVVPHSVNLSRADVFDPLLDDKLSRVIEENDLDRKCMKLEVTESAYTDNAKQLLETINRLRDSGFEIEMDDFGSGYSSLNMISAMPIDVLKMDRGFIKDIEHNVKDFRLVEIVLDIAKYLKVPVVAKGVETEMQLKMLRDAECDLVQGFYFSRPLPPEEFEKLIEKELARRNEQ